MLRDLMKITRQRMIQFSGVFYHGRVPVGMGLQNLI